MNLSQRKKAAIAVKGIGKRVKGLLNQSPVGEKRTQSELAARLKISQGSLSDIINGKTLPSAETLAKMAIVGFDVHHILTGEYRQ